MIYSSLVNEFEAVSKRKIVDGKVIEASDERKANGLRLHLTFRSDRHLISRLRLSF